MSASFFAKSATAAALVSALALPMGAHASAVAYADLTNITFSVIDLDPNDGIAASFQFIHNGQPASSVQPLYGYAQAQDRTGSGSGSLQYNNVSFPAPNYGEADASRGPAEAYTRIVDNNFASVGWASGKSSASGGVTMGELPWRDAQPLQLRVGANTMLVVQGWTSMMATAWNADVAAQCASAEGCAGQDYASASVQLDITDRPYFSDPSGADGFGQHATSVRQVRVDRYTGTTPFTNSLSTDLWVGYYNFGLAEKDISFQSRVDVQAYSTSGWPVPPATTLSLDVTAAAVPEPETLASMLLGLAVIGGLLRRRG